MAVPCGDERDYAFANFFKGQAGMQEIKNIFANADISKEAFSSKDNVVLANSDFLNGLNYKEATKKVISELEKIGQGKGKINYRLRDAVFSRQRYWGEPFPVYYVNGLPQMIDAQHLPIILPEVEKYLPTEDGLPPLGNATVWAWDSVKNKVVETNLVDNATIFPLELNTMPGWAGSSWYWMRYMDAHNDAEFASKEALNYWESVDLYIGGSEHATGHLLYSRFWNKFLKDKGFAPTEEPFKKLINQGMILGMSAFVSRIEANYDTDITSFIEGIEDVIPPKNIFISKRQIDGIQKYKNEVNQKNEINIHFSEVEKPTELLEVENVYRRKLIELNPSSMAAKELADYHFDIYKQSLHVDVSMVNTSDELDIEKFKAWREDYKDAEFITEENGKYIVGREIEKMSKSKYNVVTPDDICNEYGADTLRLYEMFLGPLEQAKPWNTAGISGVFGFLKKLWRLYFDDNGLIVNDNEPTKDNLKSLHKTIKKVAEDIEGFSFNTSVSQFMICVNELSAQNCHSRAILEPLAILISPYAPHIAEELWLKLKDLKMEELKDYKGISHEPFPVLEERHLVESSKEYPVSFNGKMRFTIELPLDLTPAQIEEIIMKDERTIKQLAGNTPKKVIIVPGKVINLVG
jgi:leucyl-tRNA synthetase